MSPIQAIKDPIPYPSEDAAATGPPHPPLFSSAEMELHRGIDDHLCAQSPSTFGTLSPLKHEDYILVLVFLFQVLKHHTANRKGWLTKERTLLKADRQAGAGAHRYQPIVFKPTRAQRADRVSKPQSSPTVHPIKQRYSHGSGLVHRRSVAPNLKDKNFNTLIDHCPPPNFLHNRAQQAQSVLEGSVN
jgi:hypothetical protein